MLAGDRRLFDRAARAPVDCAPMPPAAADPLAIYAPDLFRDRSRSRAWALTW
jgi:hypothetical protein